MFQDRRGRDKQEKRRSPRIMAIEEQREKVRKERIRKEEDEGSQHGQQGNINEMSDVGDDHFMYDNEDEKSRAKKKGRKWNALDELMISTSTQPVQEGQYPGSGISSRTNGNTALEMNRRDTYRLSNDNSLFAGVLDAQSNLQYNKNAGSGYRESLLRFVEGMGPVAQRVARQKLENLNYMQFMNDELIDDHEQHAPTQEDAFNTKADANAVSSPKGP